MEQIVKAVGVGDLQGVLKEEQQPLVLRTSDRMLFKRCRRLWGWMSHLRQARRLADTADYFWFGSGIHYALEDFHGLNLYEHPARALLAYVIATERAGTLPPTWAEHKQLGMAIMSYYADEWLENREPLTTYEVGGIPQVEVNGAIDLGVHTRDGRRAMYGFTIDRVIVDEWGRLWIVEYKTAKSIRNLPLDVDDQITAYCWAAWRLYNKMVAGVVYQQFLKKIPVLPKVLSTGRVSTDTRQATSAALYNLLLTQMYGSADKAPPENIKCLNHFRSMEDEDKDKFIVRHRIERNIRQLEAFEGKIKMELEEIADPNLPLYPNPTWNCDYLCPLQAACIAMDDGSDWEAILDEYSRGTTDGLTQREKEQSRWRNLLPEPQEVRLPLEGVQYQQLLSQLPEDTGTEMPPEQAFLEEIGLK